MKRVSRPRPACQRLGQKGPAKKAPLMDRALEAGDRLDGRPRGDVTKAGEVSDAPAEVEFFTSDVVLTPCRTIPSLTATSGRDCWPCRSSSTSTA